MNKPKSLQELMEEYIALLTDEIDELCGIADIHGWKSQNVERGTELRAKINEAKSQPTVSQEMFSGSKPLGDFEQGVLNKTYEKSLKNKAESDTCVSSEDYNKLKEALQKIQSMKRAPGENTDTYAFNRCWLIAVEALHNPAKDKEI